MNKKKIINDPVYGFISIRDELTFDLIAHPYFQRLRRVRQLGITDLVYPGAVHSRFHHALGAMHLMGKALDVLRGKGHQVTDHEYLSAQWAILLHDIGHGPFSHTLEFNLLKDTSHEDIGKLMFEHLNEQFDHRLSKAYEMFTGTYHRQFFNQLISSQLDIDRLDYLRRDSFFTGVQEGNIGAERIIELLTLKDDRLVVEEKAIYSVENFLNARRLMYWQVYLHKTCLVAEAMLLQVMRRARHLLKKGSHLPKTPALHTFLSKHHTQKELRQQKELLSLYGSLDDFDVWSAIKNWAGHEDDVLAQLSKRLLNRALFKIEIYNQKIPSDIFIEWQKRWTERFPDQPDSAKYFVLKGSVSNAAYFPRDQSIGVLMKNGTVRDIAEAADLPNIKAMSKNVKKYYLCYPKELTLDFLKL